MRLDDLPILTLAEVEYLRPLVANPADFFDRRQHYRLLMHLAKQFPDGLMIDIGTHQGDSAVALASGGRGRVHSFDIEDRTSAARPTLPNVTYYLEDLFSPPFRDQRKELLLSAAVIFIDVDPHSGTRELELIRWLQANGFEGLIVLDDIWYFKEMRDNCWYQIESKFRTDLTLIGHWSGTGIVSFKEKVEFSQSPPINNWTLVTGYFDLTNRQDASPELRARPASHYIEQHGASTLSFEGNLVVFCEQETADKVWKIRPRWLHPRTHLVIALFDDFPLSSFYSKIVENRGEQGACRADPRNTASYYLFCMARYAMLKKAIKDNPFQSTHFGWMNICIERMGFQNLVHLREALGQQRDKFSTCWIDYIPKSVVENRAAYFGERGCQTCKASCSMCSGFFTGEASIMKEVCGLIETEFLASIGGGFGHADEQLYLPVYYRHPELFEWYVGDYTEMITNYAHVYEKAYKPVINLIRNSLAAGDLAVCRRACDLVLDSLSSGRCSLGEGDYAELLKAKAACG